MNRVTVDPGKRWTALALGAVLMLSAGLRFVRLDRQPWGLHEDQLVLGTQVLDAVRQQQPFAVTDYNIWLNAAVFRLLGISPVAQRLVPALVGSLFPLSVFLALRHLFDRRVALIASILAATAIWPVVLSRSGFSISYLPVVMGLVIWQASVGWQTGRARHWISAGLLLAAAQYVYFPARVLIPIFVLSAVYAFVVGNRARLRAAWPMVPAFLLAVIPVFLDAPRLQAESSRYSGAFFLGAVNGPANLLSATAQQALTAISMFFLRGDINYRHNVPPHPVFDPPTAVFAVIGIGIMLREWKRPRSLFSCLWIASMLLPTILSSESPHFLRASGVMALVFAVPAIGMSWIWSAGDRRGRPGLGLALAAAVVVFSLGNTLYAYFLGPYASSQGLYAAFNGNETELAVSVNQFLDVGWQGSGWLATKILPRPGRVVLIDQQLWEDKFRQAALRLLVPLPPNATPAFGFIQTLLEQPATAIIDQEMRLIVLPGQEQPAVELLPFNRFIRVEDGPLTPHGPSAPPPYRTYTATRLEALPAKPLACFQEGIELLAADLRPETQGVAVDLTWRARAKPSYDYTIFTHVLAQGELVGQVDGYPALGRYLTSWWRPGDVIADERTVPIPVGTTLEQAFVRVGLYRLDTRANLDASDCVGNALGDFVLLPITNVR